MMDQAYGLRNLNKKTGTVIHSPPKNNLCRVICITSGKGGVGKSNLAVNLSLALSQKGLRVVLFDGDLGMANVDVLLGIYSRYNLQDFLYERRSLKEIMVEGPCNLKIIPGGSGIEQLANLSQEHQERFVRELLQLEREVDLIIIDTSAGLSQKVLRFISAAHELLVVVTPEPTSITDSYGIIKLVSQYKIHSQIKVIINRARSQNEARQVSNKLEKAALKYLEVDLLYLGEILEDNQVNEAVRMQNPFILSFPNCRAARSVRNLADILADGGEGNNDKKKGLKSFLNKMVKLMS